MCRYTSGKRLRRMKGSYTRNKSFKSTSSYKTLLVLYCFIRSNINTLLKSRTLISNPILPSWSALAGCCSGTASWCAAVARSQAACQPENMSEDFIKYFSIDLVIIYDHYFRFKMGTSFIIAYETSSVSFITLEGQWPWIPRELQQCVYAGWSVLTKINFWNNKLFC